jgi:branched-chain amino acid transport system permease protein
MQRVVQIVLDGVSLGGLYALVTLGIALVFGVMRLINFAHAQLIMTGAYATVLLQSQPSPVMVVGTVLAVVVLALAMERIAFRPIRNADPTTLLVTSFALSYLIQNVAILIFGLPKSVNILGQLDSPVVIGGVHLSGLDLTVIGITIVLLVGLSLFLGRSRLGIQMRGAAEDFQMARLMGVRANRIIAVAFAISGAFAGVVAVLLAVQVGVVTPSFGVEPVLIGFVATVVGGMGSLFGAAVGGFSIGILSAVLQSVLPFGVVPFRDALVFSLVIVTLLIRPQGLLPSASLRERV